MNRRSPRARAARPFQLPVSGAGARRATRARGAGEPGSGPRIRVGCCGFQIARAEYVADLDVLEVQKTFDEPPDLETAARWRAHSPDTFSFSLRAWQVLTHPPATWRHVVTEFEPEELAQAGGLRPTDVNFAAWERLREVAEVLEAPIVVFQTPAAFEPTAENRAHLEEFLAGIDRDGLHLVWEARGAAWTPEKHAAWCRAFDLVPALDPRTLGDAEVAGGPLRYWRLHGSSPTEPELERMRSLCETGETWILFNTRHKLEDARAFGAIVERWVS